jgi:hypothetical protein
MPSTTLARARQRTEEGLPSHPVAAAMALAVIGAALALLALAWRAAEASAPVPGGLFTVVFVLFVGSPWGAGYAAWVWWRRPDSWLHRALAALGALLPMAAMTGLAMGVLPFGAVG